MNDGLIEQVEQFRRQGLIAYATAYRRVYPHSRSTAKELAGGVAAFIAHESPINQLSAAGQNGPIIAESLGLVEAFFQSFESSYQAWVAPNRDIAPFRARGYRESFIRVFQRGTGPTYEPGNPAITIEHIMDTDTATPTAYGRLAATAFGDPTPTMVRLSVPFFFMPGVRLYRASIGGNAAGVARLWIHGDVAELGGAATLPGYRGRGVQMALLRYRINEAISAGCTTIITEAEPDSDSTRNVLRAGFAPAFDYAVFRY